MTKTLGDTLLTRVKFNADMKEDSFYWVTIKAKTYIYDNGKKYYDITYNFEFCLINHSSGSEDYMKLAMHPLYLEGEISENYSLKNEYSVIVIKNDMTKEMVKNLMMNDEDLNNISGETTPQRYRQKIIIALSYFWDFSG